MSKNFLSNLNHKFYSQENGAKTSVYFQKNSKKPLAVLIHGFGGNAFGMSFLSQEMSKNWRIVLVELPSHGKSSLQKIEKSADLRRWNAEIITKIEREFGEISLLVCHSFACASVSGEISRKIPTVFINPVFKTPESFQFFGELSAKSKFFAIFSNLPIFSPFKVFFLIKTWRAKSWKNVFANLFRSFSSAKQLAFQGKMTKIILENPLLAKSSKSVAMLVVGSHDAMSEKLTKQQKSDIFEKAEVFEMKTGHLLPMEFPEILAEKLEKFLPDK